MSHRSLQFHYCLIQLYKRGQYNMVVLLQENAYSAKALDYNYMNMLDSCSLILSFLGTYRDVKSFLMCMIFCTDNHNI